MHPKDADGMANSVDPDQTASSEALVAQWVKRKPADIAAPGSSPALVGNVVYCLHRSPGSSVG